MRDVTFALIGLAGFLVLICLALVAFVIVANWKMFIKAGKPGWASIVPIYNNIVLLDIIGYKWYYVFMYFLGVIPFVGQFALAVFLLSLNIKLAKAFDQQAGFGVGLWLVNPIFVAIIAFNKDIKYIGQKVNGDIDFNDLF